jgi:hypothetical protein
MERTKKSKDQLEPKSQVKEPKIEETKVEPKVEPTPKVEEPIKVEPKVAEVVDTRLRWKKIGGGHLYWKNHIIKPGEIFLAKTEDLPKAFMDTLVCIDTDALKKEKERIKEEGSVTPLLYRLAEVKGGLWNVVNEKKKPINEKPLSRELAEELKAALEL